MLLTTLSKNKTIIRIYLANVYDIYLSANIIDNNVTSQLYYVYGVSCDLKG